MTIGIADVAALLVLVLFRRRQELSTPGAPFGVHGLDVFDPDIEEAADPAGIAWRLQGDRRLVVGRASRSRTDRAVPGRNARSSRRTPAHRRPSRSPSSSRWHAAGQAPRPC